MSYLDHFIVAAYLLVVCGISAVFAGRQKSLREYFVGSNGIPWYAAAASGVATIASAASFLGGPGSRFPAISSCSSTAWRCRSSSA